MVFSLFLNVLALSWLKEIESTVLRTLSQPFLKLFLTSPLPLIVSLTPSLCVWTCWDIVRDRYRAVICIREPMVLSRAQMAINSHPWSLCLWESCCLPELFICYSMRSGPIFASLPPAQTVTSLWDLMRQRRGRWVIRRANGVFRPSRALGSIL